MKHEYNCSDTAIEAFFKKIYVRKTKEIYIVYNITPNWANEGILSKNDFFVKFAPSYLFRSIPAY